MQVKVGVAKEGRKEGGDDASLLDGWGKKRVSEATGPSLWATCGVTILILSTGAHSVSEPPHTPNPTPPAPPLWKSSLSFHRRNSHFSIIREARLRLFLIRRGLLASCTCPSQRGGVGGWGGWGGVARQEGLRSLLLRQQYEILSAIEVRGGAAQRGRPLPAECRRERQDLSVETVGLFTPFLSFAFPPSLQIYLSVSATASLNHPNFQCLS